MMRERFAEHVAAKQLLRRNERIVVAFSAGPDSLALLLLLVYLREREHYQLAVAHLDHALRPDSGLEAEHVRAICEQLGLPCFQKRVEVSVLARERGLGIEEAGREARYSFLRLIAERFKATAIVFGHQADDQVEQFWMRALRGASSASLAGIPEVRELSPGIRLVRPLLPFFRKEIEAFLAEQSWIPYQDLDNLLPQFVRNKVRHKLVPLLDELQPGWKPRLLQTMALLSEDEAWFQTQLSCEADRIGRWRLGLYSVAYEAFCAWPAALRNRLILTTFQKPEYLAQATEQPIQYRHLKLFEDRLSQLREGALFSFPARRAVQMHRQRLYFLRAWPPQPWHLEVPDGEFDLMLPWCRGEDHRLFLRCRIVERPVSGWQSKRTRLAGFADDKKDKANGMVKMVDMDDMNDENDAGGISILKYKSEEYSIIKGNVDGDKSKNGGSDERVNICYMRLDTAFLPRKLRSRAPTDRLWYTLHHRKVADILSAGAVPLPERWVYPMLDIQGKPAALAGYLVSSEFLPAADDERAVALWIDMCPKKC